MIIFVTIVGAIVSTISALELLDGDKSATPCLWFGLSLLLWSGISGFSFDPEETESYAVIKIVDSVAVIISNGEVINVNQSLNRNFIEGQSVRIITRESQWFLGMYFLETRSIEYADNAC
jgi:hypothetical protein